MSELTALRTFSILDVMGINILTTSFFLFLVWLIRGMIAEGEKEKHRKRKHSFNPEYEFPNDIDLDRYGRCVQELKNTIDEYYDDDLLIVGRLLPDDLAEELIRICKESGFKRAKTYKIMLKGAGIKYDSESRSMEVM